MGLMKIFSLAFSSIKILLRSIMDFIKDDGMIYAAATSFYFLLSFFPVILLIVYVSVQTLGVVYTEIDAFRISSQLFNYIKEVLPFMPETLLLELTKIIKSSRKVGIAGLIALMLSSTAVAESLIQAARTIFNANKAHFVLAKILAITVFIGAGILLALFLAVTSFFSNILMHNFPAVYKFVNFYKQNIIFDTILPVILIFVSYVVITYLLIPAKKSINTIAKVGLFFTSFFMLARIFYGFYLRNITKMTLFYGSISALVILILWVFYITTLYLISLEIIKNTKSAKKEV